MPSANVYANAQKIFVTPPTLSRWTGEERRLLQVLFLDYHQTKTLNNADNLFSKQKFEQKVGNKTERKTSIHNQSTVGLRFKTAIPTKWRSWCVGDSRHMVDCDSLSKSSGPMFDGLNGSRMIKEKVWGGGGNGDLLSSNLVQKPDFLISSSRSAERHAVEALRVDLLVIYRGRLCDLPPMSGHGLDGHALRGHGPWGTARRWNFRVIRKFWQITLSLQFTLFLP